MVLASYFGWCVALFIKPPWQLISGPIMSNKTYTFISRSRTRHSLKKLWTDLRCGPEPREKCRIGKYELQALM